MPLSPYYANNPVAILQTYGADSPEMREYEEFHPMSDFDKGISEFIDQAGDFVSDAWTGAKNWWYNLTGQPEKTSSYKHLEEREDSAYQRAVADMAAAGLSKYYGVSPSGSSSAGASDPQAKAMQIQELRSMKLANDEAQHNLSISKKLGIRTGDINYAAKWAELGNVLFGFDPTDVEGGLVPWVFSNLKKFFTGLNPSDSESEPVSSSDFESVSNSGSGKADWMREVEYDMNPVLPGASYDTWKAIGSDLSKLRSESDVENFVTGLIRKHASTGQGKVSDYSVLPDDKTLGVKGYSFEDDVNHFISDMISKGVDDDRGIYRIAEFIANKYHKDVNDVFKRLKEGVTFVVEGR